MEQSKNLTTASKTKSDYALFTQKMELWKDCFKGDSENSVTKQVFDLVHNYRIFQIIEKCRELAPEDKEGSKQLNGSIHRFINRGFRDYLLMGIRRLRDDNDRYKIEHPEKGTYSLGLLLKDMQQHHHLLTRRNYLEWKGFSTKNSKILEIESWEDNKASRFVTRELAVYPGITLDCVHDVFDELAGNSKGNRSFEDTIPSAFFKKLLKDLDKATSKMTTYADKFIAHAATPTNIAQNNAQNISIKLDDIEAALKTICKIMHTISSKLLSFTDTPFVVYYQFDQFAHIEKPWISKDNLPQLYEMWNCMDKTIKSWTHKITR